MYVSEIRGDQEPNDFNFSMVLSNEEMLSLYKRNGIVQLVIDWFVNEMLRQEMTFKKDQSVESNKFGKPYTFKTFLDWFSWIGGFIKLKEGVSWSQLFGISIAVLWDDQKGVEKFKYQKTDGGVITLSEGLYFPPNVDDQAYTDFSMFYPVTKGKGYKVLDSNEDGTPALIQLLIPNPNKKSAVKKVYVSGKRCVELIADRKDISHEGTSRIYGLGVKALAQEQMLKALVTRAKALAGGIGVLKGNINKTNGPDLAAKLLKLTYNSKIILDLASDFDFRTPDMKVAGEFMSLNQMMTWEFARDTRIAEKLINGESQGITASAKYDLLSTYTSIYGLQKHYNKPIEEIFYHLGKINTDFTWNSIIPEVTEKQNDFQIGVKGLMQEPIKEKPKENVESKDSSKEEDLPKNE